MVSAVAPTKGLLRLLLFAAVAIGIAGMHTLGHPGDEHSSMATSPAAHDDSMHAAEPMSGAAALTRATAVILPATGGGLDPMTVCMAIITGAGLFLLVVLMLHTGRRAVGAYRAMPQWATAVGRAPPRSVSAGLKLADLSVLRI